MKAWPGLSLLETLIALSLLGGLLVIFSGLLPQALAHRQDVANLQALEGPVQEVAHKVQAGRMGEGKGTFAPPLDNWTYEVRLEKLAEDDQASLWRMDLFVRHKEEKEEVHFVKIFRKASPP